MEQHTAKHFALQFGSLASLYLSVSFLLVLLFGLINLIFPDPADSIWEVEQASAGVRLGIAMVVVFFPTYLVLTRHVNKARRQAASGTYLNITKWLVYLSLLIGGAVLLGDLVATIRQFLEGELTTRFIFKAASVLIVVGAAFWYYTLDARGYWLKHEQRSITFGIIATGIVLASLIGGFLHIDPPADVREQKLDQTQIQDLQQIQWQVQDHLVVHGSLPESLSELEAVQIPNAPEGRVPYEYARTNDGFELCATFAAPSPASDQALPQPLRPSAAEQPIIKNPNNWQHDAGRVCFERIVQNQNQTKN